MTIFTSSFELIFHLIGIETDLKLFFKLNTGTEKNPDEFLIYYITINLISCILFIIVKIFTSFEKGQGESNLKKKHEDDAVLMASGE